MKLLRIMALSAALFSAAEAMAESYPERAVTIINPFDVGGSGDIVQRMLAQNLTEKTGQGFVVDNKPGAGGRIGYHVAAQAKPDGYTLVAADVTYSIYPSLYDVAWDYDNDLVPVTVFVRMPFVLVTTPKTGYKTFGDVIEAAKQQPGKITYSSSGVGAVNHLVGAVATSRAGVELTHVPFKGGSAAMQGLLSGNVDIMITGLPTVIDRIKAGELVPLVQTADERWSSAPEIPTLKDFDIDASMYLWYGLMAPKGTPEPVIEYLGNTIGELLDTQAVKDKIAEMGMEEVRTTPAEMAELMRKDTQVWAEAVKAAGIEPE